MTIHSAYRRNASRRLCRWLAAFCLLAIASPVPLRAEEPVGEVASSLGAAYLSRSDGNIGAAKGVTVLLDDTALTGEAARLDLLLGHATRLRLGANASLKIDKFVAGRDAKLTLDSGPLVVERGKGAEPVFEVKTPYALLAARGTEFFAGPSKGVFGVFVKSGLLDVKTLHGSVRLKAGEGTDFAIRGDPPSPVKKWGRPRVEAAFNSVR